MYLITGATGTTGRRLIAHLLDAGVPVRAVTRNPGPAAALGLPAGVELARAGEPGMLRGVTALFLHPRAVGERSAQLVAAAREQGARKVVALSAINVDEPLDEQPSRFRGDRNKEAEQAAVHSGLAWTSLRAATFASNAALAWGPQIRMGDVVRYPYARFREAPVDERDLAEVAARALLTDELTGRRLDLTGSEALSHEECVAAIGKALGRPLRFQEVPPQAAAEQMIARGMPAPFVTALMARYARLVDEPGQVTAGQVSAVLGRPARGFTDWVTDHVAAFRGPVDQLTTHQPTADQPAVDRPTGTGPAATQPADHRTAAV
ncbi:NAD(P)H-binding protein [Kitasatospora sp. NPDC006697]|uniref:NAD(P)H-binding protein n=1 Tax=Kitasatospora sp. NPDC006697 TaxID=3364020 RepID=UPI003699D22C